MNAVKLWRERTEVICFNQALTRATVVKIFGKCSFLESVGLSQHFLLFLDVRSTYCANRKSLFLD